PSAPAPAGDPAPAGGRPGGHLHRPAHQGLRPGDHEQAGLADAERELARRRRPNLHHARGGRLPRRAGARRPRRTVPAGRALRSTCRGRLMTPARSLARSLSAAAVTAALLLGALPALAEETEDSPAVTEERTDETARRAPTRASSTPGT